MNGHAGSAGGATKRAVLKLLQQQPLKDVTSVIVYCTFQAQADEVARYLYTQGVSALAYHAGKSFKVHPLRVSPCLPCWQPLPIMPQPFPIMPHLSGPSAVAYHALAYHALACQHNKSFTVELLHLDRDNFCCTTSIAFVVHFFFVFQQAGHTREFGDCCK